MKQKRNPKSWSVIAGGAVAAPAENISSEFLDAQIALSAPRHLMGQLRGVMAGSAPVAQKLDDIVKLVAKELRADACSVFVLRPGDLLELFAVTGIDARGGKIGVGEGLVGDIAAAASAISLYDVTQHTHFVPLAETGDADFKGFCGVPVLRGGAVRGVLVAQNRLPRNYGPAVVDLLQTVAMVVAELVAGIVTLQEIGATPWSGKKPRDIQGVSLGRGLATGHAVLYEPGLTMQQIVADDPKAQKFRLRQAVASMHEAIDRILDQDVIVSGSETWDILEAYQMFARDRGWLTRIESAIDRGLSAEAAVQSVLNDTRARMAQMSDGYIRDRMQDMEDLSNRLLSHLMKQRQRAQQNDEQLPDDIILIARSMGPAALLDYDRAKLKGVVLEKGSHGNHVAIVARSLGIPVVGQCGDVLNYIEAGDPIIIDGEHGVVYLRPSQHVVDLYSRSMEARDRRTHQYRRMQHQPSITRDGVEVAVQINAGLIEDVPALQHLSAEGIGLFRTELSFMGYRKYPLVVTQAELYGQIMDQAGGKPVTFRTLDIGGDKPLPYFKPPEEEENPALGWRAVRIGIDRPAILRTQFRAFIKAARGRDLRIMLPLVTEVAEFDRAMALLEMEKDRARKAGEQLPNKIEMGVMIEVPALLWQLDTLLPTVDFVSIGTNDLMQYLYAADRSNDSIRRRYDALSPAMLSVLKTVADKCRAANVPVSICGEMAGQPLEAMVLIALGYQNLSLSAQSMESVKIMIPTLDTRELLPYLEGLMKSREHSLRERLLSFARDHKINITT